MYIECLENCDKSQVIHPDLKLTMGLGSRVINSYVSGNLSLERYACINRVTCRQYNGLGDFSYISRSSVGRYCSMGARISVGAFQHPLDWLSISGMQFRSDSFADALTETIDYTYNDNVVTKIQNDVWIGDNAVIKSGVVLSTGCVVGAGSVVTKDVGPYEIVVGNPAKLLRRRFNGEIIESLLQSEWWEFSPRQLSGISFDQINVAIEQINQLK